MIIIDTALKKRQDAGKPVHVAIVGAGYIGRGMTLQVMQYIPGMTVVAIADRTLANAKRAYLEAGVDSIRTVETASELEKAIDRQQCTITDDAMVVCEAEGVEAVI